MKWMKAVLCSVLLSTAGAAVSSDEVKEAPTDYATGVALETTGHSPWYRISLPQVVYQSTAWPDLRDVRVLTIWGYGAVCAGGAENPDRYARDSGSASFPA
ncbi:DUF3999 family protein [Escherichia coli]